MIGETIGKYRIVARLGRGGMGTVYMAVDQSLERDVAIKVLNPGVSEPDVLKRFRAEAITLARLNHPNIATLYELGQHGDQLLMVMEFVRGETFDKLSERAGPMPFERAAYLVAQVLDALGHAHRVGIVHRDMKPANLILSESGVVKVMDFGIARMVGTEHLTNDGYMMGTPAYMAPEQVLGNEVDGRADLYSVGVILYRMLTGHLPFKADTAAAMAQKQLKDAPTPLRQVRAELPVWCEQILERALAKPPELRYQTADEFRSALMLSAQLAPATEVTSVLAIGSVDGRSGFDRRPGFDADTAGSRSASARTGGHGAGVHPDRRRAVRIAICHGEPASVAAPAGRRTGARADEILCGPGGRPRGTGHWRRGVRDTAAAFPERRTRDAAGRACGTRCHRARGCASCRRRPPPRPRLRLLTRCPQPRLSRSPCDADRRRPPRSRCLHHRRAGGRMRNGNPARHQSHRAPNRVPSSRR